MSAESLLSRLRELDIRLFVEGDQLRCNAPQGRLSKELGEQIAAHKLELIQTLRTLRSETPSISRHHILDTKVPLSFAQERFWFLQNFEPDTTAYNITASQRVLTPVDTTRLKSALYAVVKRHEILRTNFPEVDGSPIQVVRERMYPELAIYDLSHLEPDEKAVASNSIVEKLSKQKFDLAVEPLLRVALIRASEQDHRIILMMHHIICDAWSIGIFFAELKSYYEANLRSSPSQLSDLPIQYGDYALWERSRHSSGAFSGQIDYWRTKLKGSPDRLDVPLDHVRTAPLLYEGGLGRFQLGASTSELLKRLGRQEGATLFMVLLTVFKALLCRYTTQNDIVVGTPVSTRTQSETENLIGCFINSLVLRTEVPRGVTTREFLSRVRSTVLDALHHADTPFETLVNELTTERDPSRAPLFQIAFILQNTATSSEYEVVSGGTAFDMTLYMWDSEEIIGGCIEYNATLFNADTIARFAGCFETLAAEMAGQPDTAIERLPVLTAAQEIEWFEKYNGPTIPFPNTCIHEWVDRQANETPHSIAVLCDEEELTFQELKERSNQLANRLRGLGVGQESLVAVCLSRSADLAIVPLAIWKAGGAYVPLDPEFPSDRLAFMLEDSAATILITESGLLDRLPADLPKNIVLDRDRRVLESQNVQLPDSLTTAEDLAYVLYTSGSTGKPKGVEISHRSLANFLAAMQRQPGIASTDRLLAVTSFSFDIAGLELYLPLVSGAQVVIAPRASAFDGAALTKILSDSEINIMQATPATWRLLLESGWLGTPGLKVLCGGEALTPDLATKLTATGAEVWNLYGPTETTIWSTMQRVTSSEQVSIGRPIDNTQVCLLDEFGQPVPPRVTGELYIGGDGLARGYLGREQLTAERFVNSSFHGGKRFYRTGDLVRRLPNGELEFIGRVDHQVKIRGFRIELREIEIALEQQPGISQSVVIVREDRTDDQQLTAYIKRTDSVALNSEAIRQTLSNFLPGYMIPTSFVQLDEFPLTPNRKIDRQALLAPKYRPRQTFDALSLGIDQDAESRPNREIELPANPYAPPSNSLELTMVEIWSEILGVDKVGVHNNFFALGGHSFSAVRLISRLRAAMEMDLPLRCIFIHPTIAELSRHISFDPATHGYRYTSETSKWSCLVPVQPRGQRTPLFLVAGYVNPDDTLLTLSELIPHLGLDQPLFGFRPRWIEGSNDYASVEEMAREFLTELRVVQPRGPYLLGGHCVGGIAALEIAQLLQQEGEEVKLMVFLDTERSSPVRAFAVELYFLRKRIGHIADILSEIGHARRGTRGAMIRSLLRRKLKEKDSFYQSKVGYRRLLYRHAPKRYSGRITLIVNEEQARLDKDLGWTGTSRGGLDVHTIPGDHFTVFSHYAKEIGQVILKARDKALAESSHGQSDRTTVKAM